MNKMDDERAFSLVGRRSWHGEGTVRLHTLDPKELLTIAKYRARHFDE